MTTLENPTIEQIIEFCDTLKRQLVAAHMRHSRIKIGGEKVTKEVDSCTINYGKSIIDSMYSGAKFIAEFNDGSN